MGQQTSQGRKDGKKEAENNKDKEEDSVLKLIVVPMFDYAFAENGLTAYKLNQQLESASFIKHVGEENYKKLVNFILRYLSEVDCPVKR